MRKARRRRGETKHRTGENFWFPHTDVMTTLPQHGTDLVAFLGDQIYESGNPTNADHREGNPELDYLYKWYIFLWDARRVTRDLPTIVLMDDHDVYQGDLWGAGGVASSTGNNKEGGYIHEPDFIRMAERTQTSHNPDPYDPTPIELGLDVYYGSFTYGGISFAILEDRKFKSLPTLVHNVELNGSKNVTEGYDPKNADIPGADLLGDRRIAFLEEWIHDWEGAGMKVVFTQTLYASLHTDPAGAKWMDLDSNGWPQSARDRALDVLRKGHAFLLSGDTHLAAVVQHGIDDFGDAGFQYVAPTIANRYRRWWTPAEPGANRTPGAPPYTGDFYDGLGNRVTVHTVANPIISNEDVFVQNRALGRGYGSEHIFMDPTFTRDGYAIIRLNKKEQTITMEAWPAGAYISDDSEQHPGWPITVSVNDGYGREAVAYLPTLIIDGLDDPVVQVVDEETGDIVYTIRAKEGRFVPKVFKEGIYTVRVFEPGTTHETIFPHVSSLKQKNQEQLNCRFAIGN